VSTVNKTNLILNSTELQIVSKIFDSKTSTKSKKTFIESHQEDYLPKFNLCLAWGWTLPHIRPSFRECPTPGASYYTF
jgi:hypothetical protein